MTEPPESLTDPAHERLTKHDDALRRHYHWRTRTERPPAELAPHIRALVYTAALLGLVLALAVLGYVVVHAWPLS